MKQKRKLKKYTQEIRVRVARMYVEEGLPAAVIAQETGISDNTIHKWVKRFRVGGADALKTQHGGPRPGISDATKSRITEVKKANPDFGVKRISHIVRRIFCLPVSSETVRQTLHQENLMEPAKKKCPKSTPKPRFFERSTPNQMWQSDIYMFPLHGKTAYLIGYIDDYSRYITGIDFFRSQTAENVIETYRVAAGEYGVPKEMLTDNGRQYATWRGQTRFQKEMQKDRIHHFRSTPHHPMTLGKIERFWKTIWEEFLCRAQFDDFESARERIKLWVKYYNHKRPHQGIGGLCPADRFFEVANDLKKVIANGVAENVLEQALRGAPRQPFYMVGRLGDQSVVISAEKGKVKMLVDGEENGAPREIIYDPKGEKDGSQNQGTSEGAPVVFGSGEDAGSALCLDGEAETGGDLQGDGYRMDESALLGTEGAGSDDGGTGTANADGGTEGSGADDEASETFGPEYGTPGRETFETGEAVDDDPEDEGGYETDECDEMTNRKVVGVY